MVAETTPQSLISSEPGAPFSSSKHHDVPIEHLDYVYIGKCSDVKYLEKLLKVLRSGKEGLFPDLIEFAENRLRLLAPSSKLLNAPQPIKKKDALAADEKQSLVDDLNDFVQAMNGDGNFEENGEDAPKPNGDVLVSERDIRDDVPIRGSNCNISEGSKNGPTQGKASNGLSANRIKSGDYRAWDKFDVDAECEKIEQQEQEKIETNRNADTGSKLPSYDVNVENVTDEEVNRRAIIEKEKGNESFRANDFDEAIVYYSRSLRFLESAACFNNRCLAYLKKEQWSAALEDASKVLEMEPDNLKAKLRRSQAHFGLKDFYNARTDVEDVLKHEPSNKNALKVKADIDKANPPPVPGAKRLLIQDCDEDEDEEESEEEAEIVINNHSESSSDNSALTTATAIVGADEGDDCNVKVSTVPCNDTKSNDIWDTSEVKEEQFFDCSNKTPTPSPPMVPELPTEARKIPENVLFHKNLANDYFSKGQYHEAMLEYSNAIDKMVAEDRKYFVNAFSALWSNRAACYVKMGDLKQGILDCGEAFTADNKNGKALVRRSNCYAGLERYKEAYVDLKMAISINSSLFPSVQKEYNMYKKYLFDELGSQWERKLPAFNTYGLESQQDKYNKLKLEGNDFVKVGKHDLAIEKYSECIKIDPSKPVAYANRAQCFMSTNRHNEAKKDCDEALELLTSDPDEGLQIKVFYRRCSIQKSLKNYKAALDDLAKVMKARPNNESYSKLFGELMKLHKSHLAETKKATESSEANKKPQETVKKAPKKVKIVEVEDDDDDDCDDNDKNEKKTEEDQKVSEGVKGSKVSDVSREKKKSECSAANQEVGASREEKGNNSHHSKITGNEKAKSKSKPESSQSKALPKEAWSESPRQSQNEKISPSDTCNNVPVVPILSSQSPYEFTQAWQSLKGTNDTKVFARLLDQVEDLSKVITVKCDGEMITLLLKVLHDEFSSRSLDCVRHLESLTKLPRFKVIMMFLHQTDKAMVKDCLFNLKSSNAADESLLSRITALEKKFLS